MCPASAKAGMSMLYGMLNKELELLGAVLRAGSILYTLVDMFV